MAHPAFDLTGRVAVITGGNRGIGFGMAEALAMAGADLAIIGSNEARNADAQKRLAIHGGRVLCFVCDVAEESQVTDTMARISNTFGQIDACFANAGIGGGGRTFLELSSVDWRRVLAVNLDGVFFTLREAARHMVKGGHGGSLVAVSSLAAIEGAARAEHYAATKGGVISMVKAIAVELARHRIRANAILPGWIETDMTAGAVGNSTFSEKVMPRIPARRWGRPEDFGGLAVYLASEASNYHTGDTLIVDGGYSIF